MTLLYTMVKLTGSKVCLERTSEISTGVQGSISYGLPSITAHRPNMFACKLLIAVLYWGDSLSGSVTLRTASSNLVCIGFYI